MTDPVARASLILHPTAREGAIEGADAAVQDIDVGQIITSRDVANAPAAYLPALAFERRVGVWDPLWSVDVQRAVIEAAPEVHRHCGTPYAVKTALGALDVDADVAEWWQASPPGVPYTFHVTAYARARLYDGPVLDARLIRVVFASILAAKPLSRAFDLTVVATLDATLGLVPVATTRTRAARSAVPAASGETMAMLALAPAATARTRVAVAVVPVLPPA